MRLRAIGVLASSFPFLRPVHRAEGERIHVLTAYWTAKGGAGASVLAAAHGIVSAAHHPTLLVDLDGDLDRVLGVEVGATGVADWLAAGADVPTDALERLCRPVTGELQLLPRGLGPLDVDRAEILGRLLSDTPRQVIVDAGTRPGPAAAAVVRAADRSVLVTRACYLALRRVAEVPVAPTEIALVKEPMRALGADDVAAAVGAPVRTVVALDPGIARAVDAGLLASRCPRRLVRALQRHTSPSTGPAIRVGA